MNNAVSKLNILKMFNRKYYNADGSSVKTVPVLLPLKLFIKIPVLLLLLIPLTVMLGIRQNAELAEWWSIHVAQRYTEFVGRIASVFSISLFELAVIALIIVGIFLLVKLFKCLYLNKFRPIINGLVSLGIVAVVILNLFVTSMGFGYYRADMPIPQSGSDYNAKQAAIASQYFIDDFNDLCDKFERDENGCVICPYSFSELALLIKNEYARLDSGYFYSYTPTAKAIVNSGVLSSFLITGITFLPVGEACVNVDAPPTTITYTMTHELAHTKGVQREGDANLISYYLLISSDNDYLRYCGYYATIYSFISSVSLAGDNETYTSLYQSINRDVRAEYKFANKYWNSQPDIIGQIGEFFNNIYLTLNGAINGTGSYEDGNQSTTETPTDPDGNPIIDPETQKPVVVPVYSQIQKVYFYLYEQANGVPPKA